MHFKYKLGHKFADRCGQGNKASASEVSPIFLQFLDTTWQVLCQFPLSFEFSENLLVFLADEAVSRSHSPSFLLLFSSLFLSLFLSSLSQLLYFLFVSSLLTFVYSIIADLVLSYSTVIRKDSPNTISPTPASPCGPMCFITNQISSIRPIDPLIRSCGRVSR